MFVVPAICHLSALAFTGIGIRWCWCSLALVFAGVVTCCCWHSLLLVLIVVIVGVGIHEHWRSLVLALSFIVGWRGHWHWHSLSLVVLVSIIVSATISLYEQWLAGGVVALGDVVLGSGVVSCCCHCCRPATGPIATLQAEAHSSSVGLGRKMEAGRQQVGDESRF